MTGVRSIGRDAINMWFRRNAWANQANDVSRINVIADVTSGRIVGYGSLNAAQIERGFLPKSQQGNRPDPVLATLVGQLAVDLNDQGQGHAASLLLFALKTALRAADHVGSAGVLTHPPDEGVRRFYGRWGFQGLPFDPHRAMFVRMVDLKRSFAGPPADDKGASQSEDP